MLCGRDSVRREGWGWEGGGEGRGKRRGRGEEVFLKREKKTRSLFQTLFSSTKTNQPTDRPTGAERAPREEAPQARGRLRARRRPRRGLGHRQEPPQGRGGDPFSSCLRSRFRFRSFRFLFFFEGLPASDPGSLSFPGRGLRGMQVERVVVQGRGEGVVGRGGAGLEAAAVGRVPDASKISFSFFSSGLFAAG